MTLIVENLTFTYDETPVFQPLTFALNPNEALWLKGRNGAGKSTCLKVLANLLSPHQGKVSHYGFYCGHKEGIVMEWSVLDHAKQTAALFVTPLNLVLQTFETLYVPINAHAETLSKGQRQRLHLARAFASGADLLLFDEPTAHLDEASEALFFRALDIFLQKGSAIISSHAPLPYACLNLIPSSET